MFFITVLTAVIVRLVRLVRPVRRPVRLPQAVGDAIVQGHDKTKKKHSL